MTDYQTTAEVLAMHADQIERYGGSPGVRDAGLLEAALSGPQTGYYARTSAVDSNGLTNAQVGGRRNAGSDCNGFGDGWRAAGRHADHEAIPRFLVGIDAPPESDFQRLTDGLRHSREVTHPYSPKVDQQPGFRVEGPPAHCHGTSPRRMMSA